MEAPDMQQAGASPFLDPAQKSAGLNSYTDASKVGTPRSRASMAGLGEPEAPSRPQKRKRILVILACLGITAVIAIAIALGVHFGTRRNNNNLSTTNSNSNSNPDNNEKPPTTDGPVLQDPNDPSTFTKDPKLKNSFYGVAYTLRDSLEPNCNQTLADTIVDMQLLSQITTRIRLYSSACNQTALVLEAIKRTKTNLKVYPGIYLVDVDEAGYQSQKMALQQALQTYGTDNILGITVGNEVMLNYMLDRKATDINGTAGLAASAFLKGNFTDIRQMLTGMNIKLPIGTADAASYFNLDLLSASDFGMVNVHAWHANTTIQAAPTWTFDFFKENGPDLASLLPNKPQMYMAEVGWPSNSSVPVASASEASVANLQSFLNNFVCTANAQGTKYFYFEYMNIPWKEQRWPGVEGFWGLFNSDKTLKAITLPDCAHE